MEFQRLLRVVSLNKGQLRLLEFRLRDGENGLALFAWVEEPGPGEVIEAVRRAGKQGELAAASLSKSALLHLGLVLRPCPGGTPNAAVNAIHYEACLPQWRRLLLAFRGIRSHNYFNEHLTGPVLEIARLLD